MLQARGFYGLPGHQVQCGAESHGCSVVHCREPKQRGPLQGAQKGSAPRSWQDSNLRGETPMDF